jgi:hypothetical protein
MLSRAFASQLSKCQKDTLPIDKVAANSIFTKWFDVVAPSKDIVIFKVSSIAIFTEEPAVTNL